MTHRDCFFLHSSSGTIAMTNFMNNASTGRNDNKDYWPETGSRGGGGGQTSAPNVYSRLGIDPSTMLEHPHDNRTNSTDHPTDHNPQNITDWKEWGVRFALGIYDYYGDVFPNVTLNSPADNDDLSSNPVTFNCSADIYYDDLANISLYGNWSTGWHENATNDVSGSSNTTTFDVNISDGIYVWNCYACSDTNDCGFASANYTFNMSAGADAPTIDDISSIPNQNITEGNFTNVTFFVNVSDAQGTGTIDVVNATFTRTGESMRYNSSCVLIENLNSTQANYSCTILIWYWDGAGDWAVNATANDSGGLISDAYNETFTLFETTAFAVSPSPVTWPTAIPGDTNVTSNDYSLLNNTGNANVTVEIKALDLHGEENDTYFIGSGNFTADIETGSEAECDGSPLSNNSFAGITGSTLPPGNNSLNYENETSGQEQLYYCLIEIDGGLIAQAYSTTYLGSWTLQIVAAFAAIIIPAKRKKKKKKGKVKELQKLTELPEEKIEIVKTILKIEEIKEKYKLSTKEILEAIREEEKKERRVVPVSIFTENIGALETLVKYLKENLGFSYHEIAKLLNRNDRTIWITYRNAVEKKKEKIKIKPTKLFIPILTFADRRLSILESLVSYLRKQGFTYTKIAKLLNRNQRNIWTIYSRARKKLSI